MTVLYSVLFFMFGTLFASFAFVLAERLPDRQSILGRSRCPACGHALRLLDVLPLVGYAVNRGKCHFCKTPIPFAYVLVETAGGLLFAGAYLAFGFQSELIAALVMLFVLGVEALADARRRIVLDRVWIAGLAPLVVLRLVDGTILPHLFSAGVLFAFLFLIAALGKAAFKKEALGGGDVKLYLFIGFCLTWDRGLLSLFLAAFAGFLYGILRKRGKDRAIPLVPFIGLGVVVAAFWGADLIAWYLSLLGA